MQGLDGPEETIGINRRNNRSISWQLGELLGTRWMHIAQFLDNLGGRDVEETIGGQLTGGLRDVAFFHKTVHTARQLGGDITCIGGIAGSSGSLSCDNKS